MTEQARALSIAQLARPMPIGLIASAVLAEARLWLARQIGL